MAEPIVVMKRYELKYLLDGAQTAFLADRLRGHMQLDQYGRTSIASLYYDTPDHRLIRASMEHTPYKEKNTPALLHTRRERRREDHVDGLDVPPVL